MGEEVPWATRYASFIFLGLTISVGYVFWRIRSTKRSNAVRRDLAEEILAREVAALEQQPSEESHEDIDGSGLAGPAYTPQERAILERAASEESRLKDEPGR